MTWEYVEDVAGDVELAQLGEPTAEFAVRGLALYRRLILAPVLIGAGLALEVALIAVLHVHQHELLLLGALLIFSGAMLLVRAWRNRGLRVLVFPEGLVRCHPQKVQAFFWEEIDQVCLKKSLGSHGTAGLWRGFLTLTVQTTDDRRMTFDDSLPSLMELTELIQRETLRFLLPRALATYEEGKALAFGKLLLSQRGLSQEKLALPWSDVQKVKMGKIELLIYKKGKWTHSIRFTGWDIPNFHVLVALLEQRVRVEKAST
jgi:hypothetical protein